MELSTQLVNFAADEPSSWGEVLAQAQAADRAGVDRLVVSDHVAFGEALDAYGRPELGGVEGGRQPTGPDGHWLEPLTLLATVAAVTSRVRLGTGILIAALRRPVVLAKQVSTLDVLSGGRVDLGVGVGWQREEYDAAGLPFEARGKLLDHTLAVLETLWVEQRASFSDDRLTFEGIHQMPKPDQPGGVPIWVSGTANARVAQRLARFGSGWIPWGRSAADLAEGISEMRDLVDACGGNLRRLGIVAAIRPVRRDGGGVDLDATMERVPELASLGVTDVRLPISVPAADPDAAFDIYAATVAAFRAADPTVTPTGRDGT